MSITAVGQTANGRDCIIAGGNGPAPSPGAVEQNDRRAATPWAISAARFHLDDVYARVYIKVHKEMEPMTQLTISEARKEFLDLPEKLAREPERAVIITRRGQPVLAVLPWEFYESLVETLEVLSEPELVAELRESIKDIERGRLLSHKEVGARLGL